MWVYSLAFELPIYQTRLISIVSKPILIVVVVVVIDVVFIKKNVRSKKRSMFKKNFRQTFFGSNKVRSKKVQKIKVQKDFGSKKFLVKRSGSKNLSKNFGTNL